MSEKEKYIPTPEEIKGDSWGYCYGTDGAQPIMTPGATPEQNEGEKQPFILDMT